MPASIIDYYPETLEAQFDNQSFVRYYWDGEGLRAADVWHLYDSIAEVYDLTEAITGLTYIDCENPEYINKLIPRKQNKTEIEEEIFPVYTKKKFKEQLDYAELKRNYYKRINTEKSNSKVYYNLRNFKI
jgi:hypothetical protein